MAETTQPAATTETTRLARALGFIERAGNALPHPATLFAILAALVIVISAVAAKFGLAVTHPGTGKPIQAVSLLTITGLHRILTELVNNFTGFAPLGTVLVAILGIAVAEGSGLIGAALKLLVLSAPRRLLTFVIVFAGVMSNAASEVGYVLLVPLAAVIFLAVGRHPIVGLAAAFAGVSGGYSANLLLGTVDPLLAGLSEEAARIVTPTYQVNPACNYYFMAVSTFVISIVGTWVTEKIVAPRLGEYSGAEKPDDLNELSEAERRGLRFALVALLILVALILWGTVPASGFLRDPQTGGLLRSPFMSGIVALIFVTGALLGIAYGIGARTVRNDAGIYLVLVFFAAQFVAFFNWTNLGLIVAVKGADLLRASGLGTIPLIVSFVLVSATINLFMGSASAKWAIMAPVFVPMFMLLGYTPEFTQAAYRIGDSVTNIISPMMSYFALIVAFTQRYQEKAGIGTIIATMIPYSISFLIVWTLLLIVWIVAGLPLGPGAELYLKPAG
jgi:aminobenzoyl-glutamate transport protein